MSVVKEVVEVGIDADTLWHEVGEFGCVARWHPHLARMTVSDEPAGRLRTAFLKAGGEQLERLRAADAAHHLYRYAIERTGLPVRDYSAEFRIQTIDAHTSRLVWEAHFELDKEDDKRTVEATRYFLHEGATSIQAKYPPYAEREPAGVETGIADADKRARTGTVDEPIRNTPPAGAWNETTSD
jgi:mxaD protein